MDAVVADLPMMDREPLGDTLFAARTMDLRIDAGTILIGHSAGTNRIFSILEQADVQVRATYLLAGYCTPKPNRCLTLKDSYDWRRIKDHAGEVYLFNSFDDPFDCDEHQGQLLFDHLGGTLILRSDGHFFQPTQPLLLKQLEQPDQPSAAAQETQG
ncbi:putative esterase protein-like [Bifidobacterium actinocoloniiforme DSM 22766]|uniref:Putative esterase protein-like n=2 Tax=Bifidobacterium actinocoloniiforme TaxID=638619 RepID=A0A086Z1A1_9BIFI|nr:putative esterase protein-like [Bifidobacterium actinocoloniiforme DSM 22766]